MVVVMKDGALVGSEVFPSGTYRLGRGEDMDLRLDDARISDHHASFLFVNGQVGIRDEGSGSGIFVNGEKVKSARVLPRDEVEISPFVLKMRLVGKRKEDGAPDGARSGRSVSSAEQPMQVDVAEEQTVLAPLSSASVHPPPAMRVVPPARNEPTPAPRPVKRAGVSGLLQPRPIPRSVSGAPAEAPHLPSLVPPPAAAPDAEVPKPRHETVSVKRPRHGGKRAKKGDRAKADHSAKSLRPIPRPIPPPSDSEIKAGKVLTKPVLRVQTLWGDIENAAIVGTRTFEPGQGVLAGPSDSAPIPLYGFPNKGQKNLRLAQYRGGKWRVLIPPGVELFVRSGAGYARQAAPADGSFELSEQESVVLRADGIAVELISELASARVPPSFKPKLERTYWIPLLSALVAAGSLIIYSKNVKDLPDFAAKPLPERARLILTPKKKKAEPKPVEKKEEKLVEKKPDPKQQPKPPKEIPVRQPAVAAVTKLLNQTKVTQKLFAAVNNIGAKGKLGNGMDFKATGLIGKLPLAMTGGGAVGLGKGFGGGGSTGVGYATMAGAGKLGKGNIGRRGVSGAPVTTPRGGQKVQGELPMEAVRKVVDAHMGAIQRCYEGALIRNPSIAGKVTLEWTIGTDGSVTKAGTKLATLNSNEVIDCMRSSLVTWRFPAPKGGVVVVSYPFLFNSVGN